MHGKMIRRARLHSRWREGKITRARNCNSGKYVPWLNVNGLWLERAGFKIGDHIQIDVRNNQLIIKKLSTDKHPEN